MYYHPLPRSLFGVNFNTTLPLEPDVPGGHTPSVHLVHDKKISTLEWLTQEM